MEILDRLKSLDLNLVDVNQILDLLRKINSQFFVTNKLKKGTRLCRVRIWNELPKIPTNVSEFSYNPNPSKEFGRAHCIGESIFYASLNLADPLVPHYMNALLETINDDLTKNFSRSYFAISSWILKEDLPFVLVGSNLLHSRENKSLRGHFIKSIDLDSKFKDEAIIVDDFFSNEFSKKVEYNNDYKLSASYSKYIFENGFNAIIYNSVASNGAGLNIAINKESIDQNIIEPEHVVYGTLYRRGLDYINEYNMKSNKIREDGTIEWGKLYGPEYKLDPKTKQYFLGNFDIKPNLTNRHILNLD